MGKPRNVFVSVLGTGLYKKCKYSDGDSILPETRFIQKATLEMIGATGWTENDKILIFTTEKAQKLNWDKAITERVTKGGVEPNEGLERILEDMNLKARVEAVDIPEGKDEKEMWEVFTRIYDKLEERDYLYFDLTHAFRYLPMLVLVLGQYASHMKKTVVKTVTYGNWEARDNDTNVAPIVNLMPLVTLQDYTQAASNFEEYGKVSGVFRNYKPEKTLCKHFDNLGRLLVKFEGDIATCRGPELMSGETAVSACDSLDAILNSDSVPTPMRELMRKMRRKLADFEENNIRDNLRNTIKWCEDYKLAQQAFTLCQESLVTLICRRFDNPFHAEEKRSANRVMRDCVSQVLGLGNGKEDDESEWKKDLLIDKAFTHKLFEDDGVKQARMVYATLTGKRNTLNHAGFGDKTISSADILKDLKNFTKKYFDSIVGVGEEAVSPKPLLLINLSNHPYAAWGEDQRKAAETYGQCEDMQFPQIDPMLTEKQLAKIVDDYEAAILERAQTARVSVHVMGEMTFCFALIQRLKADGIRCIASCTSRNVVELDDHTRQTTFTFGGFRQYQ